LTRFCHLKITIHELKLLFLLHKILLMQNLVNIHNTLLEQSRKTIRRDLMDEINWDDRLIGIKGFRGVGKTTFLIDIMNEKYVNDKSCLYVNLNNFYFTKRKIISFADEFYKTGGKTLILDQIHKYPDWATELKGCYTNFPDLKIIFSASPVLRPFVPRIPELSNESEFQTVHASGNTDQSHQHCTGNCSGRETTGFLQ